MKTYKQFINESFVKGMISGGSKAAGDVVKIAKFLKNLPQNVGKSIKDSGIKASTTPSTNTNQVFKGRKRFQIGSTIENLGK